MKIFKLPTVFGIFILTSVCFASSEWYRGNTHAHTILCGHADSTPEAVTKWYHDRGYNFLILSEHNKFIDPKTVKMPANRRMDFILIPGEEVTGELSIHTTAMNINRLVDWHDEGVKEPAQIIENHIHRIGEAGGHTILNHPHGGTNITGHDILPAKNLHMLELYNASTKGNNLHKRKGMGYPITAEGIWDELLTGGLFVYGVGSDDAHILQEISPEKPNPGLGWVMVQSDELTPDAITHAMFDGHFYASSGVHLSVCDKTAKSYSLAVNNESTQQEIAALPPWSGLPVENGVEGYRIEFIGPKGEVLKSVHGKEATFAIPKSVAYVRARVTFTQKDERLGFEEYYAWGQPVFARQEGGGGI
ncbi:MAG: CehA/McbA family metallohydrolase [Verrucomicrobia bacterium]|nr:CehA/McbA family metallohydrolase [Verrucomicrobiota bacterium]MDA1068662.1 CehA/McbA family metallohydrolase [Verrucomicrobiota bacterium]